jgi:hypothetical protein
MITRPRAAAWRRNVHLLASAARAQQTQSGAPPFNTVDGLPRNMARHQEEGRSARSGAHDGGVWLRLAVCSSAMDDAATGISCSGPTRRKPPARGSRAPPRERPRLTCLRIAGPEPVLHSRIRTNDRHVRRAPRVSRGTGCDSSARSSIAAAGMETAITKGSSGASPPDRCRFSPCWRTGCATARLRPVCQFPMGRCSGTSRGPSPGWG